MGIQKIRSLGPKSGHLEVQAKNTATKNGFLHEKLLENASFNDNDDCELEEAGCECIKVGAQICSVPYELYDLADLKMILSLESWNSCLSEDERFFLAAFLPDMDQETFLLTIKELLNGDALFFGSPLKQFFSFLKGGLYCPRVTHLREGMQFLQRTEHYYFVRQYYENMRQKFMEMGILWNKCQPSVSAEERIHKWRNQKNQKPVLLVDLNAYPDENLLKVDRNVEDVSSFKKPKYMNNTYESAAHLRSSVWNTKTTAKGVLKIKPAEMKPMQSQLVQPLPNNFGEPCRRMPKGVLKIKPRYEHVNMLNAGFNSKQISTDLMDNYAPKVSHPQFSSRLNAHDFGVKPAFLLKAEGDSERGTYRNRDLAQDQLREESGIARFSSFEDSESLHRNKKVMTDLRLQDAVEIRRESAPLKGNQKSRIFSREKNLIGDYHKEPNLWQESRSQRSRLVHASSADSGVEALQSLLENTLDRRSRDIISETEPILSSIGIDRNEVDKPSDLLDHEESYQSDSEQESPAVDVSVSDVGKNIMFPITYKRKKPYRKVDQVDFLGQQPAVMNLEPDIPSQTLKTKPKSIKIKLKGWTGYNAL